MYNVFTIFVHKLISVVKTSISNRSLYQFLSATLPFCTIAIDRLGIVLPPLTIGSGPSTSCFLQGVRSNVKGKRRGSYNRVRGQTEAKGASHAGLFPLDKRTPNITNRTRDMKLGKEGNSSESHT